MKDFMSLLDPCVCLRRSGQNSCIAFSNTSAVIVMKNTLTLEVMSEDEGAPASCVDDVKQVQSIRSSANQRKQQKTKVLVRSSDALVTSSF